MLRSLGVREVLLQAAPKEYWPRSSVSTLGIVNSPRSPIEVTLCFAIRVWVTSRSSFWANIGVARSNGISHKKAQDSQNDLFLSLLCLFVANRFPISIRAWYEGKEACAPARKPS